MDDKIHNTFVVLIGESIRWKLLLVRMHSWFHTHALVVFDQLFKLRFSNAVKMLKQVSAYPPPMQVVVIAGSFSGTLGLF